MVKGFREFTARCSLALCLGVLALFPSSVSAVDNPDAAEKQLTQLSLEQLGDIQVTSVNKAPEEVWKTPAAIYVITQEAIQRSGATTIPEALRLAPGVEVARINADTWSIGIRGFGTRLSRSVLVLIDGRSVYSPLLAGVYWEVQDTLIEDVDRIEVIRGPGGTIWGPNAVNGVINIITKNSKETPGGLVSGGGGNVQQGLGEARYGGAHGKDFTYRVYGKAFAWAPEYHPDGHDYDSWQGGQAGFRMDWTHKVRDNFTVEGSLYNQDFGESVPITTYNPPRQLYPGRHRQPLGREHPVALGTNPGREERLPAGCLLCSRQSPRTQFRRSARYLRHRLSAAAAIHSPGALMGRKHRHQPRLQPAGDHRFVLPSAGEDGPALYRLHSR